MCPLVETCHSNSVRCICSLVPELGTVMDKSWISKNWVLSVTVDRLLCGVQNSVDLTPLTWSTNRVKSMGQSINDQSVNKGQRGQSHTAHAILFKLIRLCTWASKCTCNMKILQRKFYWLAFSCSRLNMPPKSLLWEHFYTNRSRFKDCWKVYWTLFQAEI